MTSKEIEQTVEIFAEQYNLSIEDAAKVIGKMYVQYQLGEKDIITQVFERKEIPIIDEDKAPLDDLDMTQTQKEIFNHIVYPNVFEDQNDENE